MTTTTEDTVVGAPSALTPGSTGSIDIAALPSPGVEQHLPEGERIDGAELADVLDGPWKEIRREVRGWAANPDLVKVEGLPKEEHRARILSQMHALVGLGVPLRGFPEYVGGSENQGGNIAGFEELVARRPVAADQVGRAVGPVRRGGPAPRHRASTTRSGCPAS